MKAQKPKGIVAGDFDVPQRSWKVLPLSAKVKFLDLGEKIS